MSRIAIAVLLIATLALGLLPLAGCAADIAEEPSPPPATEPTPPPGDSAEEPTTPDEPAGDPAASAFPWLDVELEDVQSGERFRISDFAGRPVLVKSFAVW